MIITTRCTDAQYGGMGYFPYAYSGSGMFGGIGRRGCGGYPIPCYYQPYPIYGGGGNPCFGGIICGGGGYGGGGYGNGGFGGGGIGNGFPYYSGGYPYYSNSMSRLYILLEIILLIMYIFCLI